MWIPCYAMGYSDDLSLSLKIVLKSKVRICILHIYILVVLLLPRLGELLAMVPPCVCVRYLPIM
jgi:hypothetical protein